MSFNERVSALFPSKIIECPYDVIYGDTDQMGVVYYANFFRLFERGRVAFFKQQGLSYQDIENQGYIFPVTYANCTYKKSAFFEDELVIQTWIEKVSRVKFFFNYNILCKNEILASGETVHACIRRDKKRGSIPMNWLEKLSGL